MNKYRVYFKNGRIDEIYGYSEQDALIKYRIKESDVKEIFQVFI